MQFITKAATFAVALVASATVAQAQVLFEGTTTGCFGSGCAPTQSAGSVAGLSFLGSTFSQMSASDNIASFNTALSNFGTFTLTNLPQSYLGDVFRLRITLTSPSDARRTYTGDITGVVSQMAGTSNSSVYVDFGNNSFVSMNPEAAGLFSRVNNVAVHVGSDNYINGQLKATVTPEPSTYALMSAGIFGLVAVARRRRTVA